MGCVIVSIISLGGGFIVSAGLFALITTIRVVNRFVRITYTKDNIMLIEEMVCAGAILGNIAYVFNLSFDIGPYAGTIFMLMGGIFSGSMVIALAEAVRGIPILLRRIRISGGVGAIVIAFALGKVVGGLIDTLWLK